MIKASYKKYILNFKKAVSTSRGILKTKETYFISLEEGEKQGIGECALFRGLSVDDIFDYEKKLKWVCENICIGEKKILQILTEYPSIQFGLEQAFLSLKSKDKEDMFKLFHTPFVYVNTPIPINGLIWMGSTDFMQKQIQQKIEAGFKVIKLKIGALDFEKECALLKSVRKSFPSKEIELRVDANGAFSPKNALEKLKRLSDYELHSIEQPIKKGQQHEMSKLCRKTPLPIALDEELIGILKKEEKEKLLKIIQPQYIILKPSLVGGFKGSKEWIQAAEKNKISWWFTSALESNVGLNAIAQFTSYLKVGMTQGLGTGDLFTNNIESPLYVDKGCLWYGKTRKWCI